MGRGLGGITKGKREGDSLSRFSPPPAPLFAPATPAIFCSTPCNDV